MYRGATTVTKGSWALYSTLLITSGNEHLKTGRYKCIMPNFSHYFEALCNLRNFSKTDYLFFYYAERQHKNHSSKE